MCKDKNMFALILGIMMIVLFITVDVFAAAPAVDVADDIHGAGLGKYDGTEVTIFGDFKKCGTDAFFYLILVNGGPAESVNFVLPTRVSIGSRWFYVDRDAYMYKDLGADWNPDDYGAAKNGAHLDVPVTYTVPVLPNSAVSIM